MISVMPFYADVKVILPLIVATVALVAAAVIVAFRWKNREFRWTFEDRRMRREKGKTNRQTCLAGYLGGQVQRPMKESQENQQNAETQRERYYATIHKVALQQAASTGPDKIPGEPLLRYGQAAGLVP